VAGRLKISFSLFPEPPIEAKSPFVAQAADRGAGVLGRDRPLAALLGEPIKVGGGKRARPLRDRLDRDDRAAIARDEGLLARQCAVDQVGEAVAASAIRTVAMVV